MNKRLAVRQVLLAGVAAVAMTTLSGARADNTVGDETVVASINPPPTGLGCADAAAQTSVYFNFVHPPFQIKQLSLYVDGAGVPDDAIDEQWPTVILRGGLHPGSNTVDVVANGAAGQSLDRRLVVQIGGSGGTASVACDDAVTAAADDNAPADTDAVADAPPSDAVVPLYTDTPPTYQGPDYYPAPVYVYNLYPVVVLAAWVPYIPCYGFGYFHAHYRPHHPPPTLAHNSSFSADTGGSGTVATGGGSSPAGGIIGAGGNGQDAPVVNPRPTVPHLPLFGSGHPSGTMHPAPATVATYRPAAPRPAEPVAVLPPPVYHPLPEVHAPVAPAPVTHGNSRPAPPAARGENSRQR